MYSPVEPLQNSVRVSSNGKFMATGGCDGFVRLWQFPSLEPLRDIKAHTKEIDDMDFSPDSQKVFFKKSPNDIINLYILGNSYSS